jgi:hypothetical protein
LIDFVEFIGKFNAEFFDVKENFAFKNIRTERITKKNKEFLFFSGQPTPISIVCETTNVFIFITID